MCIFFFLSTENWCVSSCLESGAIETLSVASNLELLINLALPHVMEQISAGLSDASRRREDRLSRLHEDVSNIKC